jgi:hypothetical protein
MSAVETPRSQGPAETPRSQGPAKTPELDSIWCDRGEGNSRVKIVDHRRDGRVVIERISGAATHALHREITVTREQLTAAFTPLSE